MNYYIMNAIIETLKKLSAEYAADADNISWEEIENDDSGRANNRYSALFHMSEITERMTRKLESMPELIEQFNYYADMLNNNSK